MASQSFTSRSYHTKKKDAEQDAAFEMVKCLCPQYLSEKEKLLPYATKNSFFVGSEAYRNPLDLGNYCHSLGIPVSAPAYSFRGRENERMLTTCRSSSTFRSSPNAA
jgi:hypothetical protein